MPIFHLVVFLQLQRGAKGRRASAPSRLSAGLEDMKTISLDTSVLNERVPGIFAFQTNLDNPKKKHLQQYNVAKAKDKVDVPLCINR